MPMSSKTTTDPPQSTTMETCPICCELYDDPPPASALSASDSNAANCPPHLKIICSSPTGCQKFHMCRLCVYRQAVNLSDPFVVDEDTGDFCSIDPTACPQCKRPNSFVDQDLPALSEETKRSADDEVRKRRVDMHRRHVARMLNRLKSESRTVPYRIIRNEMRAVQPLMRHFSNQGLVEEVPSGHPAIKQISGFPQHVVAIRSRDCDTLEFAESSTVALPEHFTTQGVFYYEVRLAAHATLGQPPDFKCGFSLVDGMEISSGHTGISVGETYKSWAFNSSGNKLNGVVFVDHFYVPRWYPGCVMGFAVNVDKGMIACSKDGNWDIIEKCGVKFEDDWIKTGVYPCISGRGVSLQIRYTPEALQYSPPPTDLWDLWPKYQDLSWITIPGEARSSAMAMGYTATTWALTGNPIDSKAWDDMTLEEQQAGNVLGYNKKIWTQLTDLWRKDARDNPDSDSEGEISMSCFNAMYWNDLPEDARQAALTLGYTEKAWDEDMHIPLGVKWFSQLTQEQRRAAIILGYDSQSWNEHTESNLTTCSVSGASFVLPFDHLKWKELPENALDAAEVLGYTREVWDGDEAGPLDDEPWRKLTVEEQTAATILGYNEDTWDDFL